MLPRPMHLSVSKYAIIFEFPRGHINFIFEIPLESNNELVLLPIDEQKCMSNLMREFFS